MIDTLNLGLLPCLHVSLPQKTLILQSSDGERRIGKLVFPSVSIPFFPQLRRRNLSFLQLQAVQRQEAIGLSAAPRATLPRQEIMSPLSLLVRVAQKTPSSHEPCLSFHICFETNSHYTLLKESLDLLCSERWLEALHFQKKTLRHHREPCLGVPSLRDTHMHALKS